MTGDCSPAPPEPAHLQKLHAVDLGGHALVALVLRVSGRTRWVVMGGTSGQGAIRAVSTGEVPALRALLAQAARLAVQTTLRQRFVDGAVLGRSRSDVVIERAGKLARLIVTAAGPRVDSLEAIPPLWPIEEATEGHSLTSELVETSLAAQQRLIDRALHVALTRAARRRRAIADDLQSLREAAQRAMDARPFVSAASRAKRGTSQLEAVDWTTGEPVPIYFPLNPAKLAVDELEAVFRRSKRLRLAEPVVTARHEEADRVVRDLTTVRASLTSATSTADLRRVDDQARSLAPRDYRSVFATSSGRASTHGTPEASRRMPYRQFRLATGVAVCVGRSAKDGDTLTTRFARPHELFLHVREAKGAHVILRLTKGKTATPDELVDAAHLAAHFSDERGEPTVDVHYTACRYVRKPKGAPPGLVLLQREKVLEVRVERRRIEDLLRREEHLHT